MIEGFKPLQSSANIIKFHHIPWNYGRGADHMDEPVPFASHIIHLADYICSSIKPEINILSQIPDILTEARKRVNTMFHPELVSALLDLSKKEYIWLNLISPLSAATIFNTGVFDIHTLEIDDIVDLAMIFSNIIDFRSRFTARHSAGVAKTAEFLAKLLNFSPYECKMMLTAGYLHDLGKIAISDDVLEKTSTLNEDEFNEMRAHTFYTYRMLEPLTQLKTINDWASFHHEKVNGTGYPFHIAGDSLSLGSRVMAVADVFTAIKENRPYRQGMDFNSTKTVLKSMAENGALDGKVVNLLIDNFEQINSIREDSQAEAAELYEKFLLIPGIDF